MLPSDMVALDRKCGRHLSELQKSQPRPLRSVIKPFVPSTQACLEPVSVPSQIVEKTGPAGGFHQIGVHLRREFRGKLNNPPQMVGEPMGLSRRIFRMGPLSHPSHPSVQIGKNEPPYSFPQGTLTGV